MAWSFPHLEKVAGILVLAAVAGTDPAFSQPLLSAPERERQERIIDVIQQEQTENGQYSEDLLDPLKMLAMLYLEGGDHTLAASAIERVLQVMRANYGLFTIEQLPWVHQWVRSAEARGDREAAWNLEQSMLGLISQHLDDLTIVPVLHELGDKRMAVLRAYEAGKFPPEIVLGCFYDPFRNRDTGHCRAGSRRVVVNGIVSDAWRFYRRAIEVLRIHGLYQSDELLELEMKLVRSSYRYNNYVLGRRSLGRLAGYADENDAPASARFQARVAVIDWDLAFAGTRGSPRDAALEQYRRLYQRIENNESKDNARSVLEEIFAPSTPIVLPAFAPNPLSTDETPDTIGYIDAAFEVTPQGEGRDVEILGVSGEVTRADQRRLSRLISRSTFRPRSTDGSFDEPSRVEIRYHVTRELE